MKQTIAMGMTKFFRFTQGTYSLEKDSDIEQSF